MNPLHKYTNQNYRSEDSMCIYVYQIRKNRGPGPYNFVLKRKIKEQRKCFTWRGKWEKLGDDFAKKKVTLS